MSGEKSLQKLLASMAPVMDEQSYVFVCLPDEQSINLQHLAAIGSFVEKEGLTVILPQTQADEHQFSYQGSFRLISLTVHSSLEAVGLTAAIATALAKAQISANVVAAFYHDHIFVPSSDAQKAMQCLQQLIIDNKE